MSFKSYSKWWIKTKGEAKKLSELDELAIQKAKATKKRPLAFNLVSGLYARYAMLVQEIDACLDQMCQVGNVLVTPNKALRLLLSRYTASKTHNSKKNNGCCDYKTTRTEGRIANDRIKRISLYRWSAHRAQINPL